MKKYVIAVVDSQQDNSAIELEVVEGQNEKEALCKHNTIIAAADDESVSIDPDTVQEFCDSLSIYWSAIEI